VEDVGPGTEGGVAPDCTGKADGESCGDPATGTICLKEQCVSSTCGDGYVNTNGDEECEDGNTVDGDGCTLCKYDCKADADCDDQNTCTGTETCDTATHTCQAGTPAANGTACTQAGGTAGICNGGVCVAAGCGNGAKENNEECDDGNTTPGDGCENDCTLTCKADADCDDQNPCTGTESCDQTDPTKPVCKAGTPVDCTDPKCNGTCDPQTGNCVFPDLDKDGSDCTKDCDDNDKYIYPGAEDCKDGVDNDCDPATPEGKDGDCVCYKDGDGDGYPRAGSTPMTALTCPKGYTRTKPTTGNIDCWDYNKSAHPGQTQWFTKQYCNVFIVIGQPCKSYSWDYNCNGKDDKQFPLLHTKCSLMNIGKITTCFGSGWSGLTVPACGSTAKYTYCKLSGSTCLKSEQMVTQGCH
jgi:cysteine-rich repeat protein